MLYQQTPQLQNTSPTYCAPGLTVTVRVNGKPVPNGNAERRARCLAWREGCVIEPSIAGLVVRRAYSGRVIASRFESFEAVIAAYELGELGRREVRENV
ncbi:hypothetical protein [Methylobacterium soli]|uniref:Uncharacterized protein n=2 Tax=Methylobacterium soli TaxID=553447 RepID=A0A6L3T162_9HYPH|nr:hypothetical protein [Methylobacterium soli]KAB1078399.1 hypothetical protein F6X53_15045 [Methylobacterium soli]GJE46909.1 hypothetical protein AEGHOMDF_6118 [Methylobacterium soli]